MNKKDQQVKFYRFSEDEDDVFVRFYPFGVHAGNPVGTGEDTGEGVSLMELFVPDRASCCAMEVQGDSMKDANVFPGDYVVIDTSAHVQDGDMVVAQIDGEYTIKYYYNDTEEEVVKLFPANDKYNMIVVGPGNQFRVVGVVLNIHSTIKRRDLKMLGTLKKEQDKIKG